MPELQPTSKTNLSAFIWSVADLLRGDYKQSDYGKVILPFTVLRRLDCVLEPTKAAVLEEKALREGQGLDPEPFLLRKAGHNFCNTSPLDMKRLMGDGDNIAENLRSYIQAFSPAVRDIFDSFEFHLQVDRLDKANLLYLVTEKFGQIDLHPETVSNAEMGLVFEELIRKFAELSNETAGEHFTPREVIKLMVNLIFIEDDEALTQPGIVRSLYDPTAGTGGMLSVAEEHLVSHNPSARLVLSGQELNAESYAICKADMLIKGQDINSICFGNTLSDDQLPEEKYDYMLSNPPFGVEWKKIQKEVQREAELMGYSGRFGPGLPRVSDGSLLFLLHLISKMRPAQDGGCRFGIVLNGSPLFTGGAGSGESEIRRYVLENDLLEAIIALPTDMFYNTGISTYIWILSNRKPEERKGKVQLIDASGFWQKMRKSLGSKRKELAAEHIEEITKLFGDFEEAEKDGKPISKVFKNEDFGYQTITVERPLRDDAGNVVLGQKGKNKGKPQADSSLRDTENVPLSEQVQTYFEREVLPHVPDAWIDHSKTKTGYEISFNRPFYVYEEHREIDKIDAELRLVADLIVTSLKEASSLSLPPYPSCRESGIDWLGKTPSHWKVDRLKVAVEQCNNGTWGEEPAGNENDVVCVRVADFDRERLLVKSLDEPTIRNVSPKDLENRALRAGDLLIEKSGGGEKQPVGAVVLYEGTEPAVCSNFVARMRLKEEMDSAYWRYAHHAAYSSRVNTKSIKQTSGIQNLDQQQYLNEIGPYPPAEEQKAISHFLDKETARIDATILEQQRLIALLQERRSVLISSAVKGRFDVRSLGSRDNE